MGGNSDRQHKGKIVIGENIDSVHNWTKDPSVVSMDLESQFHQGLEKCNQFNRHIGLGCHGNSSSDPVDNLDYANSEKVKAQYTSSFVPKTNQ
ncbi:unnamed protein product [Heterobilharzia americana]|nr:unnamed protein product [Heterobilharzia americana]